MSTSKPAASMSANMPPQSVYDGISRFGTWMIPGVAGWQALVLATDPDGGWIEASVDGRVVLTFPKPSAGCPSATSAPCTVDGHEVLVYAETWSRGRLVRCDVFVDGHSLTTREPVAAIPQREAAIWDWTQEADRSDLRHRRTLGNLLIVGTMTWAEMAVVGREAHSPLGWAMAAALVVGANVGLVRPWRFAYEWLHGRGWQQPWVGLAACGIAVGIGATAVPVSVVAITLAGLA